MQNNIRRVDCPLACSELPLYLMNVSSTLCLPVCVIGCLQRSRPKVDANIDVFIESSLSAECSLVILDTVEELIQV